MQNANLFPAQIMKKIVLLLVLGLSISTVFAGHHESEEVEKFNPTETIMHHISDAHDFHLFGHVSFPLPVILYQSEKGLDVFLSSEFAHGTKNAITDKGEYIPHHEKIYLANAKGELDLDEEGHAHNAKPLDFSITKNVFSMFLSMFLLFIMFFSTAAAYKKRPGQAPKGFQNLMETLIVFVRDEIAKPNIGVKYAKFLPYLLSVFFFIWINNLIGLIPFFPFSSNLTGNIAFTLVLAVITFVITSVNGNKDYWGHILWMPGVPLPLKPLMLVLELIGIFTKPFALMLRLFANITAGHIIILSLVCIIFINQSTNWAALSVPLVVVMSVLELLVAFLQAYVFTLLSALFIGQAVEEHAHH